MCNLRRRAPLDNDSECRVGLQVGSDQLGPSLLAALGNCLQSILCRDTFWPSEPQVSFNFVSLSIASHTTELGLRKVQPRAHRSNRTASVLSDQQRCWQEKPGCSNCQRSCCKKKCSAVLVRARELRAKNGHSLQLIQNSVQEQWTSSP